MGALLYNDIKMLLSKKKAALFLLFLLCIAGAAWWGPRQKEEPAEGEHVFIGVINYDTSLYSQMLLSFYQENGIFTSYVSIFVEEPQVIYRMFEDGELDMYLVIPEDFADSMVYLEHLPVEAVISTRNTTVQMLLRNLMEGYEKYISAVEVNCVAFYDIMLASGMSRQEASVANDRISIQLILQALDKDSFFERHAVENYTSVGLVSYYIHELVFLLVAYLALLAGVRFQKEHHAGILRRLVAMGNPIWLILLEKQLFFSFLLTAGLFLLWREMWVLGVQIPVASVCCACLAGYFLCALMLCFSALFQKMQNYLLASNMFLLLGAIFGGGLIPFMYLPTRMLSLAKGMPNFWFLKMVFWAEEGRLPKQSGILAAALMAAIFCLLGCAAYLYQKKEGHVYEEA